MNSPSILAFDTSSEQASIALLLGDVTLERRLQGAASHSENIMGEVGAMLAEAGVSLHSLDAIAFGAGPGAFTGVRLACALAQGLAMGLGLGVVPVGSLEALACQAGSARAFVVSDARMGEVYCASYLIEEGRPRPLSDPRCVSPQDCAPAEGDGWCGIGTGFSAYPEIAERLAGRLAGCLPGLTPHAGDVARLARWRIADGGLIDPVLAAPLYVRDKVALTTAERLARGGRA